MTAAGLVISQNACDGRLNLDLARQSRFRPTSANTGRRCVGEPPAKARWDVWRRSKHRSKIAPSIPTSPRSSCQCGSHFGLAMLAYESDFQRWAGYEPNGTLLHRVVRSALLPPHAIMDEFKPFAAPIYEQITNLTAQSQKPVRPRLAVAAADEPGSCRMIARKRLVILRRRKYCSRSQHEHDDQNRVHPSWEGGWR